MNLDFYTILTEYTGNGTVRIISDTLFCSAFLTAYSYINNDYINQQSLRPYRGDT